MTVFIIGRSLTGSHWRVVSPKVVRDFGLEMNIGLTVEVEGCEKRRACK